jgi:hypothetical protein
MEPMYDLCIVLPAVGWTLVLLTVIADKWRAAIPGEGPNNEGDQREPSPHRLQRLFGESRSRERRRTSRRGWNGWARR